MYFRIYIPVYIIGAYLVGITGILESFIATYCYTVLNNLLFSKYHILEMHFEHN